MGIGLSFPLQRPPVSYVLKEKYSTLGTSDDNTL